MLNANMIAFNSIFRKEMIRVLRIWQQTLVPPVITTSLYFLIFGELIGRRIGDMAGVSYIEFIVPGIIMMSIITNAYSNVASSFFSAKFQRSIEELLVAPVPNIVIILGYILGGVCRAMLTGAIVTCVALLFVPLDIQQPFMAIVIAFLTAFLFASAGLVNAIFAKNFDDISLVPTFVLTPLTYLGGIFYSVTLLNDTFRIITQFNPVFYMVNGMRNAFIGVGDVSMLQATSTIVLMTALLFGLAWYLVNKGIGLRS